MECRGLRRPSQVTQHVLALPFLTPPIAQSRMRISQGLKVVIRETTMKVKAGLGDRAPSACPPSTAV